jgi:hypothetical protein
LVHNLREITGGHTTIFLLSFDSFML